MNSFRENYSFFESNLGCGNNSRRKLFKGGNYSWKYHTYKEICTEVHWANSAIAGCKQGIDGLSTDPTSLRSKYLTILVIFKIMSELYG